MVKDSKDENLRADIPRFVYTPYQQETDLTEMTFYVRLRPDATGSTRSVC